MVARVEGLPSPAPRNDRTPGTGTEAPPGASSTGSPGRGFRYTVVALACVGIVLGGVAASGFPPGPKPFGFAINCVPAFNCSTTTTFPRGFVVSGSFATSGASLITLDITTDNGNTNVYNSIGPSVTGNFSFLADGQSYAFVILPQGSGLTTAWINGTFTFAL